MKKTFLILCVFICMFCLGLSLIISYLVLDEKQEKELSVYRDEDVIEESLSISDEKIVEKLQKEHPQIDVTVDTAKNDEISGKSYAWYSTSVYVEGLVPDTEYVVVLEYLNLKTLIIEALLYEPDLLRSYSKDDLSSEGRIVFPLQPGKEGTYMIVLYGTGDIGGFTTYIAKREDFMKVQKPNVEYPRDLMREDALIDE